MKIIRKSRGLTVKIYCIKIDSMPFLSSVLDIARRVGGMVLRQVSGCFTIETIVQMMTGKHSSCLENHGIGYHTWISKVEDISKAVGPLDTRPKTAFPDWSWIRKSIPFLLKEQGYECIEKNSDVLGGSLGYLRYPDFYKRIPTSTLEGEINFITDVQTVKNKNILYFINYNYFHDICNDNCNLGEWNRRLNQASCSVLNLLSHWNFKEPDSMFWIFSDHGPWLHPKFRGYPEPTHFFTWSILRDNTDNPIKLDLKIISAKDFFSIVMSKFGNPFCQSKDKIYITEDGRLEIIPTKSTTAIACRFSNWINDFPTKMEYLIYHEIDNKFIQMVALLDEKSFVIEKKNVEIESELVASLVQNFDWITP